MSETKMTVTWQDVAGQVTLRTLTTQSGASTLLNELLGKSNAVAPETWEGTVANPPSTATAASYAFCMNVAYLRFADASGFEAIIALPAPQASIFLSDGLSVDPTQITSIISAAIGNVLTAKGTLVTTFVNGYLGTGTVIQ